MQVDISTEESILQSINVLTVRRHRTVPLLTIAMGPNSYRTDPLLRP